MKNAHTNTYLLAHHNANTSLRSVVSRVGRFFLGITELVVLTKVSLHVIVVSVDFSLTICLASIGF